jgi:SAM-dependent methyltransferase
MNPLIIILNFLRTDELANDINGSTRIEAHRLISEMKPEFLRVVADQQHDVLNRFTHFNPNKTALELGAGSIPLNQTDPSFFATDIVREDHLDVVLSAMDLGIRSDSVDVIAAIQTFHHLNDPSTFFVEAIRVLKPGGRIILIEPFHNYFSRLIYPHLFHTENYLRDAPWVRPGSGPMTEANQALSYCVFVRDSSRFSSEFSQLKIVFAGSHATGLRYLLTGGLNFRKLAPNCLLNLLRRIENRFPVILKPFAIHWVICLEKVEG